VRRRPYAVVLFDEIEKAHTDVFNVLLQILDDGRLTDGQGRTVDFKNTVLIMTSNVGSAAIQEYAGGDQAAMRSSALDALRAQFRPEFLNRIDEVIVFHTLGREQIDAIINIQLALVLRRLEDRKIQLRLSPRVRALLADEGYDPVYGARPLRRVIQRRLLDPLAMQLLEGGFAEGDTVLADLRDGQITFSKDAPSATVTEEVQPGSELAMP